jgi:ABC-type Zn uptake system ZnuABC Zn-binding protein ZnuA
VNVVLPSQLVSHAFGHPVRKSLGVQNAGVKSGPPDPRAQEKHLQKLRTQIKKNGNNYALIYERAYSRKLAKQ